MQGVRGAYRAAGMKIYLASSWRNPLQPVMVAALRAHGHDVYDFRDPAPGEYGFAWSEIEPRWTSWSAAQCRDALDHPIARHGFSHDMTALMSCEACVLLLPCGRSAHLELGWACGAGKQTIVFARKPHEPELMYAMCDRIVTDLPELLEALDRSPTGARLAS